MNKKDESEGETEDQQFSVPDTFAGQDDEMLAESLNVERYTQSYKDRKNKYAWWERLNTNAIGIITIK